MAKTETLPTKYCELISVAIFMIVLSTVFTAWRIVVRFKVSPRMHSSDWLMILGATMNNAAMSVAIIAGFNGAGRLLEDPFWKPDTVEKMVFQNRLTFASQIINVYGMWIVKVSVCAYLLELNFSRRYRWVVWGTLVFATIFNFVLPVIQHFGLCRPLASRWDIRITDKHCWSQMVRISIAYTQAISNIMTDLVYATAPIAYIRSVKLSKRTLWSVRAVFLMSLVCTAISAIKLWDFQRIQGVKEAYYESVTLSIWSMTEVSVGVVVANLPPLRKYFDSFLEHIVCGSFISRRSKFHNTDFPSLHLSTYRSKNDRNNMADAMTGRSVRLHSAATDDNESGRVILDEVEFGEKNQRDCEDDASQYRSRIFGKRPTLILV